MNINGQVIMDWAYEIGGWSTELNVLSPATIAAVIHEAIKRADKYRTGVMQPDAFRWQYAGQESQRLDFEDPVPIHGAHATMVTKLYEGCPDIDKAIYNRLTGAALPIDEIMHQVQVFASSWSLLGSPFEAPDQLEVCEREKLKIRSMLETVK